MFVAVVLSSIIGLPGHPFPPALCNDVFGPPESATFPDVKITPAAKGKSDPFASKAPIPLTSPKSVPVLCPKLETSAHELSINMSSINC